MFPQVKRKSALINFNLKLQVDNIEGELWLLTVKCSRSTLLSPCYHLATVILCIKVPHIQCFFFHLMAFTEFIDLKVASSANQCCSQVGSKHF